MKEPRFLVVQDKVVNADVITANFACDLSDCKGACCTLESDFGAPLKNEEIAEIEKNLEIVKPYLPKEHLDVIDKNGYYEILEGEAYTVSYKSRACVFVYYDKGVAKCGIEAAYNEGKSDFRKPISCFLFPIRVSDTFGDVLRYEKYTGCSGAVSQGNARQIKLVDFLEQPLVDAFGKQWYSELKDKIG